MSGRSFVLAALVAILPAGAAFAQQAPAPSGAPAPAPAPAAAPAASGEAPAPADTSAAGGAAAPAGSAAPASNGGVSGYSYGGASKPKPAAAPGPRAPRLHHHANEVVATLPGFEMLADGGSRLFVQLTKTVDFDQAKSAAPVARRVHRKGKKGTAAAPAADAKLGVARASATMTITLKGTEVVKRNNENALVTVHFNTPVTRARLVPAGRDLRFVIELRDDVAPNVHLVATKDGGAMLQVDFPSGNYLPAGAANAPGPEPGADDSANSEKPQ